MYCVVAEAKGGVSVPWLGTRLARSALLESGDSAPPCRSRHPGDGAPSRSVVIPTSTPLSMAAAGGQVIVAGGRVGGAGRSRRYCGLPVMTVVGAAKKSCNPG